MVKLLTRLLRSVLPDEKIWELKNRHNIPSMEWSLMNLRKLGIDPVFAIDVGAFEGEWTRIFKKIFPRAKMLMIEAQEEKAQTLEKVSAELPGTNFHIGLLGSAGGQEVVFHVNSTVSSVLEEYKPNTFKSESRSLETLDSLVARKSEGSGTPDFIKLDVQGYELEVLKGAERTLAGSHFVLCEVSLLEINKGAPLIADVIRFMDASGFCTYDICSFIRRPLDRALWQTDLLFIRKAHPLIQNKHWS